MYLDTDIILALIKEEDWLKEHVKKLKLNGAKTSAITIIEARIVLDREYSRIKAIETLDKIKNLKIEIIPLDEEILNKSQELIKKYLKLGTFDSIHASTAIVKDMELISTDNFFEQISELKSKDPRTFN